MNRNNLAVIKRAIAEDGARRDVTTNGVIPGKARLKAVIIFKQAGVICGLDLAREILRLFDKSLVFKARFNDGDKVRSMTRVAQLAGQARAILSAERLVLNFLSHLSGIATLTRAFVDKASSRVKIADTRKTIPNLRSLQRYAVVCGQGFNHRFGLADMVMIKDNHREFMRRRNVGVESLIKAAREKAKGKKIEIEVENLRDYQKALRARPDIIMLDNMRIADIKKAVKIKRADPRFKSILLEVSGKVNLDNIRRIAKTGVDMISIGELTHSARAVDVSLEVIG